MADNREQLLERLTKLKVLRAKLAERQGMRTPNIQLQPPVNPASSTAVAPSVGQPEDKSFLRKASEGVDSWATEPAQAGQGLSQYVPSEFQNQTALLENLAKAIVRLPAMLDPIAKPLAHGDVTGALVGTGRTAEGLARFYPDVIRQFINVTGAGIPTPPMIGEPYTAENFKRPTSQETINEIQADPSGVAFVLLPFLKSLRNKVKVESKSTEGIAPKTETPLKETAPTLTEPPVIKEPLMRSTEIAPGGIITEQKKPMPEKIVIGGEGKKIREFMKKKAETQKEPWEINESEWKLQNKSLKERYNLILNQKLKGSGFEKDYQSPVYRIKAQEAMEQLKKETKQSDITFGTLEGAGHKAFVRDALEQSKPVYPGWEKDYPDLAAKYKKPLTSLPESKQIVETTKAIDKKIRPMILGKRGKEEVAGLKGMFEEGGLNNAVPIFREEVVRGHYMGGSEPITYKYKSTTHEAFLNKYPNRKEMVHIFDKALKESPLTERQRGLVRAAYKDFVEWKTKLKAEEEITGDLNLKHKDEVRINGEWYRVAGKTPEGELIIKDGLTYKVDPFFDKIPIDRTYKHKLMIRRNVPVDKTNVTKIEFSPADPQGVFGGIKRQATPKELGESIPIIKPKKLEQISIPNQAEQPRNKILGIGKKVSTPINQANIFNPDKVKVGNLPQDQTTLFIPKTKFKKPLNHKVDLRDIEARDLYGLLSDAENIPEISAFTEKLAKHENKQIISDNASGRAFHRTIDEATRKAIVDYLKTDQEIARKNLPDHLVHPKWQRFINKFEAMATGETPSTEKIVPVARQKQAYEMTFDEFEKSSLYNIENKSHYNLVNDAINKGKIVSHPEYPELQKAVAPSTIITKPIINKNIAESLRQKADALTNQIEAKKHPAISQQNVTARRTRIAGNMWEEGERIENIQKRLYALADASESGTVPKILSGIRTKADVETLLTYKNIPGRDRDWSLPHYERMVKIGIKNDIDFQRAKQALEELSPEKKKTIEELRIEKISQREKELRLYKEKGFFVTPKNIAQDMARRADIQGGESILEPSAGLGNIADNLPKKQTKVIEQNYERRQLLADKGYDIVGQDFLEHTGKYDKIIMNPPFENMQDVVHIQHAYDLLKPGGKIVSIMGESPFFRTDKKAVMFRDWLESVGGTSEKLPLGAFKESGTGVSSRIVEITKSTHTLPMEERGAGINPIPYVQKAAKIITPDFLKQARNRVESPEGKTIVDMIEKADNKRFRRFGQQTEKIRQLRLHEMTEADGLALADKIERGKSPEFKRILDEMFYKAKAVGVDVSGFRQKYFPRMMKRDYAEVIYDEYKSLSGKITELRNLNFNPNDPTTLKIIGNAYRSNEIKGKTRLAIDYLIRTKQAKSPGHAYVMLQQQTISDMFRPFGNLEKKRIVNLPKDFYERDARKVLPRYIDSWSQRLAEVEVFGSYGEKAMKILRNIENPKETKMAEKLIDIWSGEFEREHGLSGQSKKIADMFTSFEFGTKIGLGTASIPNVTQSAISSIPITGIGRFLRSGVKLFDPKYRSTIRSSGATIPTAIRAFAGYEPTGIMGKVSDKLSKLSGFYGINKINQYLSAASADVFIKDLYGIVDKGTAGKRLNWARKQLQQLGLNPSKKLTENGRLEAIYRFATDSQLQKNILNDPLMFNHPALRPLTLFKRFGYRQFTFIKDKLIKQELIKNQNPLPLLRMAVFGYAGGEFVIWAKQNIMQAMSGEPVYRKDDHLTWERLGNNLAAVGALGMISDIASADYGYVKSIQFAMTPVAISEVTKAYETLVQIEEDSKKYDDWAVTMRRSPKRIAQFFGSLPKYLATQITTPEQQKYRERNLKGQEQTDIIDLYLEGKSEKAQHRIALWNEYYPQNHLFTDDKGNSTLFDAIQDRKKNKLKY